MLTNEQCIKVAELWGYKVEKGGPEWGSQWLFFTKGSKDDLAHSEWITLDLLQHEIHSWKGFGKTVEAMSDSGWILTEYCDGADYNPAIGFYNPNGPIGNHQRIAWYNEPDLFRNSFIEATHLAALEAIKDK